MSSIEHHVHRLAGLAATYLFMAAGQLVICVLTYPGIWSCLMALLGIWLAWTTGENISKWLLARDALKVMRKAGV